MSSVSQSRSGGANSEFFDDGASDATYTDGSTTDTGTDWELGNATQFSEDLDGQGCEFALFTASLIDEKIAAMSRGAPPLFIEIPNLKFYVQNYGDLDPEPDHGPDHRTCNVTGAARTDHAPKPTLWVEEYI